MRANNKQRINVDYGNEPVKNLYTLKLDYTKKCHRGRLHLDHVARGTVSRPELIFLEQGIVDKNL